MSSFRKKIGTKTLAHLGEGFPIDEKALGATIGSVPKPAIPSEEDGDGDGFRTGPDGKDNIPVTKPIKQAIKDMWSDKSQKALEADEQRAAKVAEILKKRSPKHTVKEMHDILVNAKMRPDIINARKETTEWAKSIFEIDGIGNNGEYKVRLFDGTTGVNIVGRKRSIPSAHNEEPYSHIRISGEILDKDNKSVGFFERHIYLDEDNSKKKPYAYHEILRLKEDTRGQGIGADFTMASEAMYAKLGIDSIHLNAGLSDGGYTWLRAGYGFKSDKERVKVAKVLEERYKEMLKDAGSKEKLVAGGFTSSVGRHFSDDESTRAGVKMPEPMFESMEDLDKFLKMLGQLKGNEVGSKNELHPSGLALFGDFSKRILRGMNFDVKKDVRTPSSSEKSLITFSGLDKLFTRV
jgi:hypothetical protein